MRFWFKNFTDILSRAWRLRPHLRGGRYLVGAVALSAMLGAFMEGVGVGLLVPLFSLLLSEDIPMRPLGILKEWMPNHTQAFYVVVLCLIIIGAIAAKNLFIYSSQVLTAALRRRISINLRDSLFQTLHRAELSLFEHHTGGEVANLFFQETERTLNLVDMIIMIAQRSCIGLFYLVMLFVISAPLTLFTVILAIIIMGLVGFLYKRLARSGEEFTKYNQKLYTCVVESFAGIRVVRNTNSEKREIARFKEINEAQTRVQERYARASQMLSPIAETVAVTGAMLIAGGAFVFFVRPGIMRPSYLAGFGLILVRLLPLVNQLYSLQGQLIYLSQGLKEVGKWLETPEHPSRPFGDAVFPGVKSMIRLENISYVYPNGTPALQNVSFDIKAGTTVALVGASGSGKSTVATLLLRFRPCTEGKITVDGCNFWDFSAESWHTSVAVVEQDAFLFHDSLLNNIGYGFPAVEPGAVEKAVKIAHLEDVVKALPEGLKTVVGERGTLLSGGQRQRLAIARAIVRDPQILILDEATSALDNLSEREVQTALEEAMHGRTALVIAHRLSTIRDAHHIVVLDKGRVAEQGTWEELMANNGPFAQMVNTTRDSARHIL